MISSRTFEVKGHTDKCDINVFLVLYTFSMLDKVVYF